MKNKKRLMYASLIGVASVLACVVQAQVVPSQWDVKPWTNGVLFERFETLPGWATNQIVESAGWTNRADRFWGTEYPASKQLVFATLGITNTFSNAKIQPGVPIFIDMRCKLNPFDTAPLPIEQNTVLCFYANEKSNLVVATGSPLQCQTNTLSKVDPSVYYAIMIRFASDKFDVFFDTTNSPTFSLNATTNQISKMVISGAGEMDDLYISYGDPRRSSTNSAVTLSPSPVSDEEKIVASWLANNAPAGSYTQEDAKKFYLTDTVPTSPTTTFDGELGIGTINYDPITLKVTVAVTLKTGAEAKKGGKINGILNLKGAETYDQVKAGSWTPISATKFGADDFTAGVATYTFTLPSTTYKFFRPVIVSNIK